MQKYFAIRPLLFFPCTDHLVEGALCIHKIVYLKYLMGSCLFCFCSAGTEHTELVDEGPTHKVLLRNLRDMLSVGEVEEAKVVSVSSCDFRLHPRFVQRRCFLNRKG
jgi:hypothetical protein